MGKYYIKICECGHIHFLDNKKIVDICENGGTVLHVCTNCGKIHLIGLEDHGNSEFWWYCYRVKRNDNLDVKKESTTVHDEKLNCKYFTGGKEKRKNKRNYVYFRYTSIHEE